MGIAKTAPLMLLALGLALLLAGSALASPTAGHAPGRGPALAQAAPTATAPAVTNPAPATTVTKTQKDRRGLLGLFGLLGLLGLLRRPAKAVVVPERRTVDRTTTTDVDPRR